MAPPRSSRYTFPTPVFQGILWRHPPPPKYFKVYTLAPPRYFKIYFGGTLVLLVTLVPSRYFNVYFGATLDLQVTFGAATLLIQGILLHHLGLLGIIWRHPGLACELWRLLGVQVVSILWPHFGSNWYMKEGRYLLCREPDGRHILFLIIVRIKIIHNYI